MFTTIRRWGAALLLVFAGWLGVMALVMLLSDAAPGAVVLFPSADFIARLPDGVAVVGDGPFWIALRGGDITAFGQKLYAAGGWIVLPAGLPGCLPLPDPPGAA